MQAESKVRFRPSALRDLSRLYEYIAHASGPDVAFGYVERIEQACAELAHFPERGMRREGFGAGIRTIGFERRATIIFRLNGRDVQIVRILYGGQDLDTAMGGKDSG